MQNEWSDIANKVPTIQSTKNKVLNPIILELLVAHSEQKRLFDYGCGWGEFAQETCESGFTVTAFDEAVEMVNQARSKFEAPLFLTKEEFYEKLSELENTFDVVTSNLVLCILEKKEQQILLDNIKRLLADTGIAIISLCHPQYDYLADSLVSRRFVPPDATYEEEFIYQKEIKENGAKFSDYHRPLGYYTGLFNKNGFKIIEQRDSDTFETNYKPDFIIFVLKKI